ncbi:hypothetical protein FRC01_002066 [Tulasnella sp. 417]|nr:hypothetical protein FRC01_002066 [Tulasnella sp. 417]
MKSATGGSKTAPTHKRKNAAPSPPPSDRQTRARGGQKSSAEGATPAPPPEATEPVEPKQPRKRSRHQTRKKNATEKLLDVILEEGEEVAAITSPTGKTRSAAEILIGISALPNMESLRGQEANKGPSLDSPGYSDNEDEGEESPGYSEESDMPKPKKKKVAMPSSTEPSPPTGLEELESTLLIHYQLMPRRVKALKTITVSPGASYNIFRQLVLTELAIPQHKWEGRRLGLKMPNSRVADHPLELTESQYQETTRLLKENAIAVERQKKAKRKVPTIIDLKTYEAELEEKEARRSKKTKGKGKKKPELSDGDSDVQPNSDNDASATTRAKTMTRAEATELLHSKRTCALHNKMCRILPGGQHVPWSLDAITVWATLICEGEASPDEIPHILKDDARPRAQESRRASSRDTTPAPPVPIEIKMVYPNLPAPTIGNSGTLAAANPPSSPTVLVSTADPLIEDFLDDLDTKYHGRDFRNFKQYLSAFEEEAVIRITELGVKDIKSQGAEFYRRAPFNMPRGNANLFFTALKASLKALEGGGSLGQASAVQD